MNGVSHMLPFVIAGGIFIAISFLLDDPSLGLSLIHIFGDVVEILCHIGIDGAGDGAVVLIPQDVYKRQELARLFRLLYSEVVMRFCM